MYWVTRAPSGWTGDVCPSGGSRGGRSGLESRLVWGREVGGSEDRRLTSVNREGTDAGRGFSGCRRTVSAAGEWEGEVGTLTWYSVCGTKKEWNLGAYEVRVTAESSIGDFGCLTRPQRNLWNNGYPPTIPFLLYS